MIVPNFGTPQIMAAQANRIEFRYNPSNMSKNHEEK